MGYGEQLGAIVQKSDFVPSISATSSGVRPHKLLDSLESLQKWNVLVQVCLAQPISAQNTIHPSTGSQPFHTAPKLIDVAAG